MVRDPHGAPRQPLSVDDHYPPHCPFVDALWNEDWPDTALVGAAQAMRNSRSWTDGARFERDFDRFTAHFTDPRGPQTVARGARPGGRQWASVAGEIHRYG